MKELPFSNCVGFVYYMFKLTTEERYINPPTLQEVLKYFDRVDSIDSTDALAVVDFSYKTPLLVHIAIVNDDNKTITHRVGIDGSVIREKMELGLNVV